MQRADGRDRSGRADRRQECSVRWGLRRSRATRGQGAPAPYAREFQGWVFEKLKSKDTESLVSYRSLSAHGVRAHPTDEHFLPLFVALGAAGEDEAERVYDTIDSGVLAMDAYYFGARS